MAIPIRENQPNPPGNGRVDCERAFAAHRSWLWSVILARLGEPQAAEEVLQEVALAVVANRAPLVDPDKLAPWLYQIAVRQTLLYRRKHGRRRKLIDRYADRYQPTSEDDRTLSPLDWLLAEERAELFRQSMEQLSERDREVLLLKYEHGWSYRKISQHLGLSESAVEARLHRARQRLRHRLVQLNVVGNK
jgi:RNA polymerase sigma-70 factor (ECF subfamily)